MKETIAGLRATITMLRMKLGEKAVECEKLKTVIETAEEELEFMNKLCASQLEQIKQLTGEQVR